MSKISFVHLSDIHFQTWSGNEGDIDTDLRDSILTDLSINANRQLTDIKGILITGDIAFSGCAEEYANARSFLKQVTDVFGINESSVYCVPGNHDVDQNIPKKSPVVYAAQNALDEASTLDNADFQFRKHLEDMCFGDALFKTIQNYNDFAEPFSCCTNSSMINWKHAIDLDFNMKLKIYGLNSSLISNADDHLKGENRPMFVGRAQIPHRDQNTIIMSLCHHPPELWKFYDQIQAKVNKRMDIQLYGHKHEHSAILNENNAVLYSGAAHPVRGNGWKPRYYWFTVECIKPKDERIIVLEIYPRVLSDDGDCFHPDYELCKEKNIYIEHQLKIDKKRKRDMHHDRLSESDPIDIMQLEETLDSTDDTTVDIRELKYGFFSLSYIKQTEILLSLGLLNENDRDKKYVKIMPRIIDSARQKNVLIGLWDRINNERTR